MPVCGAARWSGASGPGPAHPGQGPAWHGRGGAARSTAGKLTDVPEPPAPASRLPRRAAAAAALVAALAVGATGLAGCAKFDSALGQQWATVSFKADTSIVTLLKVRAACSRIPNVRAEALPRKQTPTTMMYALTYRTDNASDANLAQLEQCLQRFPSVQGIQFGDSGDAG
jgi:hypothetical protein